MKIEFVCIDCDDSICVDWQPNGEKCLVVQCPECSELYAVIDGDEGTKIRNNPKEEELRIFENPLASECEHCGQTYEDFRTGETFQTVIDSLWVGSQRPEDWNHKTRHSVLGRWFEIKQSMWADHLEWCEEEAESDWREPDPDESEEIEFIEY